MFLLRPILIVLTTSVFISAIGFVEGFQHCSRPRATSILKSCSSGSNGIAAPERRELLRRVVSSIGGLCIVANHEVAKADVLRSDQCANGEGDGCDGLAEGNEFIKSLQIRSSANKEANQRVSYSMVILALIHDILLISLD